MRAEKMSRSNRIRPCLWVLFAFMAGFTAGHLLTSYLWAPKGGKGRDRPREVTSLSPARGGPAKGGGLKLERFFGWAVGLGGGEGSSGEPLDGDPGKRPGFGEENPFLGRPAEELTQIVKDAAASRDFRRFKLAAEAMGELTPSQVAEFSELFLAAQDPKLAECFAQLLVRYGGKEGLDAVARFAKDDTLPLEMRGRAMEALAQIPPDRREEGIPLFKDLLGSGLPEKLQFHAAYAYGRLLGPAAVSGLLELLDGGGIPAAPLLHAMRDFATSGDVPALTELLSRTGGRDEQEILLRALGSAAGKDGSRLLLGLLEETPAGVRRDAIGSALAEFAGKEDLSAMWDCLKEETDRKAQAALARAIARIGGSPEIEKLAELAHDPGSVFSQEAFARALHDVGDAGSVPMMLELLKNARTWEASEPLAHAIARMSGREGIENLLSIAAQGGNDERLRAIIQAVEDFGDGSYAERLGAMLENERDHGVSFHLAKAMLHLDPSQGPQTLADSLGSFSNGDQRAAIADLLQREGTRDLIPALSEVLRTEEYGRAQWHLARTLASYGSEGMAAVEDLLAKDADPGRRAEMLRGVESFSPQEAARLSRELLQDPSPEVRLGAAQILARSGDPAAHEDLVKALSSETNPEVRQAIAIGLAKERTK